MIIPVKGSYDDAYDLSVMASEKLDIYNRNTGYNPFTIEGKKTAALEIFYQMENQLPDRIFVPVGDGCILAGMYKGFEDLLELEIIEGIPEIVAVQAENSANLVNNIKKDRFMADEPYTLADSISVKIPRNFYMAKDYLIKYKGKTITVSDQDILSASQELAGKYGLFSEPAAAASYAGYQKFLSQEKIGEYSRNLVLLTGSGLKDIKPYINKIDLPRAIEPNLNDLKKRLRGLNQEK